MTILQNFKQLDFIEQIQALEEIQNRNQADALPELFDLFIHPLKDNTIDYMIERTLRDLLSKNEAEMVAGLSHEAPAIRKLCVRECGQSNFSAVAPRLITLMAEPDNKELIHDLLYAMSRIRAPVPSTSPSGYPLPS